MFRPIELKRDNAIPETVARHKQTAKQTQPEAIGEVVGRIRRNVARAKAGKISAEEFRTAVQMVIALHAQENATIAGRARQAALGELFGLGHNYDKTFDARIEAVRLEDVVGAARRYLNNYLLVTTSPQEQPIESCITNGRVPAAACVPLPGIAEADKPPLAPNRPLATQGSIEGSNG